MKKLFLIDGVAGTGKTDMMGYIKQKYPYQATILTKYTTRPERIEDSQKDVDLTFLSLDDFNKIENEHKNEFYSYYYGDEEYGFYKYGFNKKEIINAINNFEYVIVIIRSKRLIDQLILEYGHLAFVVPVYIYSDRDLVIERLKKDGYTADQVKFRLNRTQTCWDDYIENDYFDIPTIINNSNKNDFHRKINQLFNLSRLYENSSYFYVNPILKYELIKPLIGYKNAMQKMIEKYPFEKNVFLMMKFRKNNDSTYEFIKDELSNYGYNCIRADQDDWQLTGTTFNPMSIIYCCKYGIALFDEPEEGAYYSANVAYELGMMQTQNKECLILVNSSLPSPPFDIVKDLYKTYTKESQFKTILKSWMSKLS